MSAMNTTRRNVETMKTAFAAWNNRIAPVFDVARHLHIVETESGRIVKEARDVLTDDVPAQKALHLAELGIGTLVCGAISRPLQAMVAAQGIRVVSFVAGDLREVIEAWRRCRLDKKDSFAMPGCCGRSRMKGGSEQEERAMTGKNLDINAGRGGRGHGRGVQGFGRRGGPLATGPGGLCVCPRCGRREPHERGIPCTQKQCPTCGIAMMR
jgi:predicted Fe-Mo cluster-binding NifX family protein